MEAREAGAGAPVRRGELMISRRENFHRVYDLRERVLANALPDWDASLRTNRRCGGRWLLRYTRSASPARWVPDYFRTPKKGVAGLLEELAEGELVRAGIEGLDEPYVHPDNAGPAEKVLSGGLRSSVTTLLSPFDPVVWDRARARALRLRVQDRSLHPAARRRYGYYSSRYSTTRPRWQARRQGPPQRNLRGQGSTSSRTRR